MAFCCPASAARSAPLARSSSLGPHPVSHRPEKAITRAAVITRSECPFVFIVVSSGRVYETKTRAFLHDAELARMAELLA
ncbi:MAG: hypothetical protein SangKO_014480 [Sandaracinaceae bacterium]